MSFDFSDFAKGLKEFKDFFTVKHITVLVFVALALVLVCTPHQDGDPSAQTCSDASCPFPKPKVIEVPPIVITAVSKENVRLDFSGEGWEDMELSRPEQKIFKVKLSPKTMVLLIKEETNMSFGQYVVDSIQGFNEGGAHIASLKQVTLNNEPFILMASDIADDDVLMAWSAIKDGFGYTLCCFYHPSADAGTEQHDLCVEIAESLQIK